tara:strand:- start:2925 stop:3521 length:597 start_codon:yes stop_codon:yes gene_type:complete
MNENNRHENVHEKVRVNENNEKSGQVEATIDISHVDSIATSAHDDRNQHEVLSTTSTPNSPMPAVFTSTSTLTASNISPTSPIAIVSSNNTEQEDMRPVENSNNNDLQGENGANTTNNGNGNGNGNSFKEKEEGDLKVTNDDEVSPHGRYVKLDERLGSGAYKDVWRAYDTLEGMEVAWNIVKLGRQLVVRASIYLHN